MRLLGKHANSGQLSTRAAKKRLLVMLMVFITALVIPLGLLANHVYKQFREEMIYAYKWNAEQLIKHTNKHIYKMLKVENERAFGDYQYFKWKSDPLTDKKKRVTSPLAHPEKMTYIPGFIGHFQIDADNKFSSPLLPNINEEYFTKKMKMDSTKIKQRIATRAHIEQLLNSHGLLKLANGKLLQAPLNNNAEPETSHDTDSDYQEQQSRTEESYITPKGQTHTWETTNKPESTSDYTTFVVEIDPFQWQRSDNGLYFFYRKVWRQNKRYIQGFIVNETAFLEEMVAKLFAESKYKTEMTLQIFHNWNAIKTLAYDASASEENGIKMVDSNTRIKEAIKIHSVNLRKPLDNMAFTFTSKEIPLGCGTQLVSTLLLVVSSVIALGVFFIYRAGIKQIMLAEERLNFVSAVSHELKTPLTSILMYSEMLKEGMISDGQKKKSYYDFIFFESERLSRLIGNVLHLSRLGKHNAQINIEACSIHHLSDLVRSKTHTLLQKNAFKMNFVIHSGVDEDHTVMVEQDAFAQIVINLVDNAIKFSVDKDNPEKANRQLDIGFRLANQSKYVTFYVRDYGPGISADKSQKIFQLFYRVGDELTRTTPGTGIGLALVSELVKAMNGTIELQHRNPGAEFCVSLPLS